MIEEFKDLQIGFIGFSREQTINNFKSFVKANKVDLKSYDIDRQYFCIFKDNTFVRCLFKAKIYKERYDQVIISDDARMLTEKCLHDYYFDFSDIVPEDLRIIHDNIDEE